MIKTGYISFITETGGGQDVDGNTEASVKTSSVFIECNLMVIKKEYKTFIDGQYRQASYSMYIDNSKFESLDPSIDINTVNLIELKDNNQNSLGTFQVHNKDYLNLSRRIKIVV
jgi:hypothetical protein